MPMPSARSAKKFPTTCLTCKAPVVLVRSLVSDAWGIYVYRDGELWPHACPPHAVTAHGLALDLFRNAKGDGG